MKRPTQLQPRVTRRIALIVGGVSLTLLAGTFVLLFVNRTGPQPPGADVWGPATVTDLFSGVAVCVLGILIVLKRPTNTLGWLFLVAASFVSLTKFSQSLAVRALAEGSISTARVFAWINNSFFAVPITMLFLLLLLFPTGTALSRRWRRVVISVICFGVLMVAASVVVAIGTFAHPFTNSGPKLQANPPAFAQAANALLAVGFSLALPIFLVLSLVCLILRLRRSRGEERLQLKWFTFAAAIAVAILILNSSGNNPILSIATPFALSGLWVAIGIAMLKYRLYEINVVIRKTVVGGVLVVFITLVYVVVVAGIGVLGSDKLRSGPLIAAATALIAIAFQPVLRRARHLANRLVFGDRATPYEVLSAFSERMGSAVDAENLPQRMARILGEGTGAATTTVWLHVGNRLIPAATWPADDPMPASFEFAGDAEAIPEVAGADGTFPVRHEGELLGALSVAMPPSEPLAPDRATLGTDLAAQAGLVLRNVRLIEELRASRQRLVKAQDEERRRIERNIHDGAQQQLVALAIKANLAETFVGRDEIKERDMLGQLKAEATDALENLRELARGIYPPLLADKGLAVALEAQANKSPISVTVQSDGIERYPREVEAAVYFCCLEALQNVAKYAGADAASVALSDGDGSLTFEVIDDGHGFDTGATAYGTGLQGMADRLDSIGGSLKVKSSPGHGTSVTGTTPVNVLLDDQGES